MESNPEITPELLLSHAPSLRALARRLVQEAAAEDVVQETWLAALERPPGRSERLGAWLRSVLRNRVRLRARGELRREARDRAAARPEAIESTAELVERRAALGRLVTALETLPEPYGDAVWMRYFEELPPPEIARRLGVAEATVRTRIHRGLALLRQRLEREPGRTRGAWVPTLAAASGVGTGAGFARSAAGAGALIMSTNIKIAAVAGGLVVLFFLLWRGAEGPAGATSPEGFEPEMEELAAVRVPVEIESLEAPADSKDRAVVASPEPQAPAASELVEPEPSPVVVPAQDALLRLRRRLLSTTELKVKSMELRIDGRKQSAPVQRVKKAPDIDHEVVVLDEVLALGFGQAQRVRRTYERLAATRSKRGKNETRLNEESPILGVPLMLDHDPSALEWRASLGPTAQPGDSFDRARLDGLAGDLDLRDLAPPPELPIGASHAIPPEKLKALFRPCGELFRGTSYWWDDSTGPNPVGFFAASAEAFAEAEGELVLVLRSRSREDSSRPRLTFELALELNASWNEMVPEDGPTRAPAFWQESEIAWSATGELTWDVEENRVETLRLEGPIQIDARALFPLTETRPLMNKSIVLAGESSLTVEVEELSEWPEREKPRDRKR